MAQRTCCQKPTAMKQTGALCATCEEVYWRTNNDELRHLFSVKAIVAVTYACSCGEAVIDMCIVNTGVSRACGCPLLMSQG